MSKKVQDQFKDNIPASLRNNDLVLGYAEAVGEVFEEIRQDIKYKAFETDYAKSRFNTFENVTSNFGLQLSPYLKEDVVRRIIRDMPKVYTQMGTRGSLEWALKTLGYRSFQIDETWVPNPDLVRKGYFRELFSPNEPRRYNINVRSYTDFVVGEEYVTEQGTFFKGFAYTDFEKDSEVSGVPIYGEAYSTYTGMSFKDMVSKTPYLITRLYDPPYYDEVISDIDPATGEPVAFNIQEKQKIITDTIRYLIQKLQRTATTTIILVTDLLIFDDIIDRLLDDMDVTYTSLPLDSNNAEESFFISDTDDRDGKHVVGSNFTAEIGDKRLIGQRHPYPALGEYVDNTVIGPTAAYLEIYDNVRAQNLVTKIIDPPSGYKHIHYLDFDAAVSFSLPSGVTGVTVEKIRNFIFSDISSAVLIDTVSYPDTFSQTIPDSHALIITIPTGFSGEITITSTY